MIASQGCIQYKILSVARVPRFSQSATSRVYCPTTGPDTGNILLTACTWGQAAAFDVTVPSLLQSSFITNAGEKSYFALSVAEDRNNEQHTLNCGKVGIQFNLLVSESLVGFSAKVGRTLKQIATLANNRSLQPVGLYLAFSRFSQSVSAIAIRWSAILLIARDPGL